MEGNGEGGGGGARVNHIEQSGVRGSGGKLSPRIWLDWCYIHVWEQELYKYTYALYTYMYMYMHVQVLVAQATLISKAPPRVYSQYFNKFHVTSSNILISSRK